MKFYVTALVLGICAFPLLFSGCVGTPTETTDEFKPGSHFEDILAARKDAAIVRPPVGAFEDGSWHWFLVRIGEDEYCVIDERGLVVRTIKQKFEFSAKGRAGGRARYSVADPKLLEEYLELTRKLERKRQSGSENFDKDNTTIVLNVPSCKQYVGLKLVDVLRTEGRLIYACSYDTVSDSSLRLVLDEDESEELKRILDLRYDNSAAGVAEFVLALNGGKWLILYADSKGTIVGGGVADMPPKHWCK